ncbi:MAG: hypothetical protein RI945_222 [Candidatus Parcubacteria bacterium]|jgi:hypothetical protein
MNFENPHKNNFRETSKSNQKAKKGLIKTLLLAGVIAGGLAIAKNKKEHHIHLPDSSNQNNKELVTDTSKVPSKKNISDTLLLTPEEIELESKRQKSFYEEYAKDYHSLYGDSLYQNQELLSPDFSPKNFRLTEKARLLQYFLRNGREKTFEATEKLGSKYHQTKLSTNDSLVQIFRDAGIDIEGEIIEWVEVPGGRSGGMSRDGKMYGGNNENIMTVEGYIEELDGWIMIPAQKAGYVVDTKDEFNKTVANEMSHEIQYKYFSSLFGKDDFERLDEPFKSFKTTIPNLKFRSNFQAAEFLSDVADWSTGNQHGAYFRFFNPLYYMSDRDNFSLGKDGQYWYSYQVQKYAMEQVLKNKGYKNAKKIVQNLIEEAEDSDYKNHDELFVSARKYFQEEDFKEISKIYRSIGVQLLAKMKPYFEKKNK